METLTNELKEHGLNDKQIKRIIRTIEQGKTVHTTHSTDIVSIFWNDQSNAEIELTNGNTIERKLA